MHGEPRRPLPPVGGHDEHRVGGERHGHPSGDPDDADVHAVLRTDQHVLVLRPQTPQDDLLEELGRRLPRSLLAHRVSSETASTTARSWRTAPDRIVRLRDGADHRDAGRPRLQYLSRVAAWIPPIPTTGSAVAAATSRSPSSPTGTASGLVSVAHTVTPR